MSNQPPPAPPVDEIPQLSAVPSGSPIDPTWLENTDEGLKVENDCEIDQLSTAFGVMRVDPGQTIYLGGAHWVSIMSEVSLQTIYWHAWLIIEKIREFRNYFDSNHEELEHVALENRASAKGPEKSSSLLLGTSAPKTLEELISYIPPRTIADELVTRCFNYYSCILRKSATTMTFLISNLGISYHT